MEGRGLIKNRAALGSTPERQIMLDLLEAGFGAIDVSRVMRRNVELRPNELRLAHGSVDLESFKRLFVVGFGKAAAYAAATVEDILGELITDGVVIDVTDPPRPLSRVKFFKGTHPLPSPENERATRQILALLDTADEQDLVLMLISGGGSALLDLHEELTCEDEIALTKALFEKGANIHELNTIRKHISRVRGGNLARYAYPARVMALIFSDVPGNDVSVIASGPTVLDHTTKAEAEAVLAHYNLKDSVPLTETPKKPRYFERVNNIVILENTAALSGMVEAAKAHQLFPVICTDCLAGEARGAAKILLANIAPGQALLAAGETTVKVRGKGVGGRNHEFVLGGLADLKSRDVLAAVASDGWDNCQSAGAIADSSTLFTAQKMNLDPAVYLDNNDSYNFFKALGSTIETGRTGTNVSDFMCAIRFAG